MCAFLYVLRVCLYVYVCFCLFVNILFYFVYRFLSIIDSGSPSESFDGNSCNADGKLVGFTFINNEAKLTSIPDVFAMDLAVPVNESSSCGTNVSEALRWEAMTRLCILKLTDSKGSPARAQVINRITRQVPELKFLILDAPPCEDDTLLDVMGTLILIEGDEWRHRQCTSTCHYVSRYIDLGIECSIGTCGPSCSCLSVET